MAAEIREYLSPLRRSKDQDGRSYIALQRSIELAKKECNWEQESQVLERIYTKML